MPSPTTLRVGLDDITLHVDSAATGGALVAAGVRMPAGGGPPLLHRHAATEIYRVDRGELAIYRAADDGSIERIVARPGDVVLLAGGREHTIRNESDGDAEAYVVFAPGTDMEAFVRGAAALTQPDMAAVLALAEAHGITMTRPVPALSGSAG